MIIKQISCQNVLQLYYIVSMTQKSDTGVVTKPMQMIIKRLFIGVPIQSEMALQAANHWSNDGLLNLNRMVWTKPLNWHVTLFFLGATPESQIAMLQQLIDESFHEVYPFATQLSGVGVFPEKGRPRVLWLGLENIQPLMPAYAQLGDLLLKNEFLSDPKPLMPHLTLARIKSLQYKTSLELLLKEYHTFNFGTIDINRITLFESISTASGVIYESLFEKWLLKDY